MCVNIVKISVVNLTCYMWYDVNHWHMLLVKSAVFGWCWDFSKHCFQIHAVRCRQTTYFHIICCLLRLWEFNLKCSQNLFQSDILGRNEDNVKLWECFDVFILLQGLNSKVQDAVIASIYNHLLNPPNSVIPMIYVIICPDFSKLVTIVTKGKWSMELDYWFWQIMSLLGCLEILGAGDFVYLLILG